MPRVLMKVMLDGTEIRSVPIDAHNRQSMVRQAEEWCAEIRKDRAELFRILVFSTYFGDFIDLTDDHVFVEKERFCLLFNSGATGRTPPGATRDDDTLRVRGTVGDTKIDLEIDRKLAVMAFVGAVVVVPSIAYGIGSLTAKSPAKALGMFSTIFKQIDNKKDN